MKYVEKNSTGTHSVGYAYDSLNNLTALVETIGDEERKTSYTYDEDNRPTSVTADGSSRSYTYDAYGRVSTLTTKHGNNTVTVQTYTYKSNANGAPTNQISSLTVKDGNGNQRYTYTYTYDQNGNITGISDGTYTTSYAYDSANQLIREDNQQAHTTTIWTYDNAGNILTRTAYPYTTGEVGTGTQTKYVYNDPQWGDLLIVYKGMRIVRDEIGNPKNDLIWSFTWQHGRQLASMIRHGTSVTWEFTYNADGLRTKRTNGTTTYNYTYLGGQLTHMTVDGHTMYFAYDASGVPLAMTYNGVTYYYVTNLQGDVVAILDSSGAEVVRYAYDAWGNPISTTGTLATTIGFYNPLRYRGYVYDEETKLYYLQSRYYDPEMGRFINGDGFTATGQGLLGNNMFAYCGNRPVCNKDVTGTRYIAATSVSKETAYHRRVACYIQKNEALVHCGKAVDITYKLNEFMRDNVRMLEEYKKENGRIKTWFFFRDNVTDGGALDIKLQDDWKFEEGKIYLYQNRKLREDDPGNINFGYVGAAIFPRIVLCYGAGKNQRSKYSFTYGDFTTFWDDPRDNWMIKYGHALYKGMY